MEKILILFICFLLSFCSEKIEEINLIGSFYSNDCGEPRGGWEWTGEYSAELTIVNGSGTLYLKQTSGLGDPITNRSLNVEDFKMDSSKIEMKINGIRAVLVWTEKDKIWGEYNYHYIGNNSPNQEEKSGSLSPSSFPGLPSHFYVELRLRK
ncbi:MAG: hypothetical protein ACUVUG_09610 [Candidatus Aminicenantia bacterium]